MESKTPEKRPLPAWVWIIGGLIALIFIAKMTGGGHSTASTYSGDSNRKAVYSVSIASRLAGGFSDSNRRLYERGIAHLRNVHQRPGSYTIGQVIQDEYTRESVAQAHRDDIAKAAHTQVLESAESGEKQDLNAIIRLGSQSSEFAALVRGFSISDDYLNLTLDADYWDPMSSQDRDIFKQTMYNAWAVSYNQRHGTHGQHVWLELYDLAGNKIDSYY